VVQENESTWNLVLTSFEANYSVKLDIPDQTGKHKSTRVIEDCTWRSEKRLKNRFTYIVPDMSNSQNEIKKYDDTFFDNNKKFSFSCRFDVYDNLFSKKSFCADNPNDWQVEYSIVQGISVQKSYFPVDVYFNFPSETPLSFIDFVKANEIESVVNLDDKKLLTFRLRYKIKTDNNNNNNNNGSYADITINRERSSHIEKIRFYFTGLGRSAETDQYVPIITETKIEEYQKLSNGIYFPKTIISKNFNGIETEDVQRTTITTYSFNSISLSSTFANHELGFRFPPHSIITETIDKDNFLIHLWSDTNVPSKTFSSPDKFASFLKRNCSGSQNISSSFYLRAILFLLGLLFIVTAWFIHRRSIKK
jgi:hypothetical protein